MTAGGLTDIQTGQSLRELLQAALRLIGQQQQRGGDTTSGFHSFFIFLSKHVFLARIVTVLSSGPVGGSGGFSVLLCSDFLPFPLELRFPRCFRAGTDARTDSGTEWRERRFQNKAKQKVTK